MGNEERSGMTDVEVQPRRHAVLTDREKAELRGQVFRDRSFDGFDFDHADLSFATFIDCSLVRCSFRNADLRHS